MILDSPRLYVKLNKFKRTLDNAIRIIKETDVKLIIYEHHLPREPRFRERTKEVWNLAKKLNKNIITAAEFLGKKQIVLLSEE